MDGTAGHTQRLIVGISRSRASWWALAWATGEARRRGAHLLLVHVYHRRLLPPLETDPRYTSQPRDPDADRVAKGNGLIWQAIGEAVGQLPAGITVDEAIVPGRKAVELARLASGDDILVLGARHRGWLRRFAPGSVARACYRRAGCLVVVVPEPSPKAIAAGLPADAARGHWRRWGPHRETRTIS